MNIAVRIDELKRDKGNACLVYACNLETMQACCILAAYDKQMDTLDLCLETLACDHSQAVWGIYPAEYDGNSTKHFYEVAKKAKEEYYKQKCEEELERLIARLTRI